MKGNRIIPIIFIEMLVAGMLLIFIAPKNQVSEAENRRLAKLPELSVKSVFSGEFASGINSYLNDHFPLRTAFIEAGDNAKALMSYKGGSELEVYAGVGGEDMGVGENLYSKDAQPEPEPEPEKDTVPEAAHIDVPEEADYNRGGIIISGTRAMELFGYYYNMLVNYAAKVNAIQAAVPGVKVYSLVVPTSVEFYSPVKYHTGMRSQKDAVATMYSMLTPGIGTVDAYVYLAAAADQYIYFRTDHHWTARGAYQGYYAFCKAAGLEPLELESFPSEMIADNFVGTLYRYTKSQVIKDNPDYVEVYLPPEIEDCIGYAEYHNGELKVPYDVAALVDPDENESNKYKVFLGGDAPLFRIITPNKNGRRLLIIRDSYSNAMALFFAANYEEIFLLDPRLLTVDAGAFCKKYLVTDVLFENYATVLKNDGMASLITKLGE